MKAFAIIQGRPIVVAEYLFIEIPEQVKWLDVDISSLESTLEQAPEILQSVCMHLPIDIALGVVNRLVNEILIQSLIGHERIGVDRTLRFDVCANLRLQVMLAARRYNTGAKLPAA